MSDFDALQATLARQAADRQADADACEALLGALYQAFRRGDGPGQPLHNVSLEPVPDPEQKLRPPPVGEFHAAWFRLGLCEVLIRVRRQHGEFHGEYATRGRFALSENDVSEESVIALARRILREVATEYSGLPLSGAVARLN